ncbi:MAG: site-specific integrase [Rivularia sp. T60_A2020_040]|nr:site-specific integrase [Rivularia sp. T60_A2020_040]
MSNAEELLRMVDERIAEINQELKDNKTKVAIARKNTAIILKATLPLKPDDKHDKEKKQYQLSLGIPANLNGCQTAKEEAQILGTFIARHNFKWNDKYLGQKTQNKLTFQYVYDNFEKKYYEVNQRTFKSQSTVYKHLQHLRLHFDFKKIVSAKYIETTIKGITSVSVKREVIGTAGVICKLFNIEGSFGHLRPRNYKPKQRTLPTDKDIILSWGKFAEYAEDDVTRGMWRLYRLIFSIITVYGLRPKEVLVNPDVDWFLSEENVYNSWRVCELCKTGAREVIPFVPDWVYDLRIKDKDDLLLLKERCKDLTFLQVKALGSMNTRHWAKIGVGFQPYDLRHACAIRAHLNGIPLKLAAQNLGHSVSMHTETYQQWLSLDQRKVGFDAAFEKMTEVERLRLELADAKLKIETLKIELERTKLQSSQTLLSQTPVL